MDQAKKMAEVVCRALEDKKGEEITILDIRQISILADYFIITHGNSNSQVSALVEHVEEQMQKAGFLLKQREGRASGSWVLLDYGDVIVHVFDKENREFYHLERIWSDGVRVTREELSDSQIK